MVREQRIGDLPYRIEDRVTGPADVGAGREAEILSALQGQGMLRYEFGTDVAFITQAGFDYCKLHGGGDG